MVKVLAVIEIEEGTLKRVAEARRKSRRPGSPAVPLHDWDRAAYLNRAEHNVIEEAVEHESEWRGALRQARKLAIGAVEDACQMKEKNGTQE